MTSKTRKLSPLPAFKSGKTIRRDSLYKHLLAGNLEFKCNYRYTDDYAYDASSGFGKTDWLDGLDENGNARLDAFYFTGHGRAYWNVRHTGDGVEQVITLIVHSNLSYSLRIKGR